MLRSAYYYTFSGDIKCRYDQKLKIIDNVDPYSIPSHELVQDVSIVPNVTMMDLVNYLILTHSFYTGQQFKAYKSLQAYKQYEAGSVQSIVAKQINAESFVVVSKVNKST